VVIDQHTENITSLQDDCGSAACSRWRQDSGNKESMDDGSSFSSPPMMVSTLEA